MHINEFARKAALMASSAQELSALLDDVYDLLDTMQTNPHNSHHSAAIDDLKRRLGEH